jgi:CubicO group peptidase (beta-lactamase class C family)
MKRLWHLVWLCPLAVFGYLWVRADYDARYVIRVLWHGGSSTSDYRWKASRPLAASAHPRPWREVPDCPRVTTAVTAAAGAPMETYLTAGGALGFVVIHDGALVCEWYGNGGAKDAPAAAFSATKTLTSLLLARAIDAHAIGSLDDAITKYIPELGSRDRRFEAVTLGSLVDMRSGIAFVEAAGFPWVTADDARVYYASDLAAAVVKYPRIAAAPGGFLYNDYAPNLNGLAIERALGRSVIDALAQPMWDELGAEFAAMWSVDGHGFPWFETGLVVTARDFARIGQLILDGGKVGDRVVAAAWVARSLDPAGRATVFDDTTLGYRNGWWVLDDHTLAAMGKHGQIMVVSLATRSVIVRFGLDGHDETNISIARRLARVADQL